jgi:hypothetical protein
MCDNAGALHSSLSSPPSLSVVHALTFQWQSIPEAGGFLEALEFGNC